MKNLKTVLLGGVIVASFAVSAEISTPAMAVPLLVSASGCPNLNGLTGTNSISGTAFTSSTTDCNEFITFNANGSITTTLGPSAGTFYDVSEDSLIGVINNTSSPIFSFNLTNAISPEPIFGFDGDGVNVYTHASNACGDGTGYGGEQAFFTSISGDQRSGTVNFCNGIAANGGTGYFSLENPATLETGVSVPEPGTIALLGAGLLGLGAMRRRRKAKA